MIVEEKMVDEPSGDEIDEARRLIESARYEYDPSLGLAPMYDFFLSLHKSGFDEKQALWIIASGIFGKHRDKEVSDNDAEETPSS